MEGCRVLTDLLDSVGRRVGKHFRSPTGGCRALVQGTETCTTRESKKFRASYRGMRGSQILTCDHPTGGCRAREQNLGECRAQDAQHFHKFIPYRALRFCMFLQIFQILSYWSPSKFQGR